MLKYISALFLLIIASSSAFAQLSTCCFGCPTPEQQIWKMVEGMGYLCFNMGILIGFTAMVRASLNHFKIKSIKHKD